MYHPDRIRQTLAVNNICTWLQMTDEERNIMENGKWCKLTNGFVRHDYQECRFCIMCEEHV